MKAVLGLRNQQHLSVTPKLQQAIKLLQLSTLDLQNEIQEIMNNNPLLEGNIPSITDEIDNERSTYNNEDDENEFDTLFSWDTNSAEPMKWPVDSQYTSNLEQYCEDHLTLKDYLHWQFNLCPSFSDLDRIAGTAIIDSLNNNGFLIEKSLDLYKTIFDKKIYSFQAFETVRHYIQCLDPVGCATETLPETLLVQLQQYGKNMPLLGIAKEILKNDSSLLATRAFGQLQKKYRISIPMIEKMIAFIQTATNPNPACLFHESKPETIIPDLYLIKKNGSWNVQWNSEITPHLSLNSYYLALISKAKNKSDRQFLQQNLHEAKWFIKNIENRQEIILKVAQFIVDFHYQFFANNCSLKPLILSDVANALDIHVSTVSRAVNNKYLYTPKGLFELKHFLSSPAGKNNELFSAKVIQAKIKEIIQTETTNKPLTDECIVQLLQEHGIKLARRTVAKYREFISLSSSHRRKNKK